MIYRFTSERLGFDVSLLLLLCTHPLLRQDLVHTVAELCLTSSVKFLQPGLLLRGYAEETATDNDGLPRQSWLLRKAQEKAVKDEGMASWQANAYYASGRVSLPAIIDTFSCVVSSLCCLSHPNTTTTALSLFL